MIRHKFEVLGKILIATGRLLAAEFEHMCRSHHIRLYIGASVYVCMCMILVLLRLLFARSFVFAGRVAITYL